MEILKLKIFLKSRRGRLLLSVFVVVLIFAYCAAENEITERNFQGALRADSKKHIRYPRTYLAGRGLKKAMAFVPGGEFRMGSNQGRADERPVHRVGVFSFYMDKTPVTYENYRQFVKAGGRRSHYWYYNSYNKTYNPVTGISWYDAVCFANWRSSLEGRTPAYLPAGKRDAWGYRLWRLDPESNGYRLPTEAEFERAARGGLRDKNFPWGDRFSPRWANFDEGRGVSRGRWWRLSFVHDQKSNSYGLHGMSGNVWEWTGDWYDAAYYKKAVYDNPTGPESGRRRVIRGGSWGSYTKNFLRTARRSHASPDHYNYDIGFRLVLPARRAIRYPGLPEKVSGKVNQAMCYTNQASPAPAGSGPRKGYTRRDFGPEFRKRLAAYLADRFPESVYFLRRIDRQPPLTPRALADLIVDYTLEFNINPVFLTGIMVSESGMGTVSFPRWFNNPMAYHWGNWKMRNGRPLYKFSRYRNRRYRDLKEAFRIFSRGIRRKIYLKVARKDLYAFHHLYVGYEAREWMFSLGRVYRDLLGVRFDERFPGSQSGRLIYLDWDKLK